MVAGGTGEGAARAGPLGVTVGAGGASVGAGVGSCPQAANARLKSVTPVMNKVLKRFGNTRFYSLLAKGLF
jgi:hypothetical protein